MDRDVVIEARGLGKRFRVPPSRWKALELAQQAPEQTRWARLRQRASARRKEQFWALQDVSFDVHRGEVLAIVGSNGAGKSTLLKLLASVTEPTTGRAEVRGRLGSLLEVGTGFHQDLTGRDNIYLNGAILGMRRREIAERFDDIVEFSGVGRFLDTPVKYYSSGMYVRLAFAVAAHLDPDILLVDEVLSVGDQAFQEKCLGRMRDVTKEGRTVIFVSHNIPSVLSLCDRGILIESGRVTFDGGTTETIETYLSRRRKVAGEGLLHAAERDGTGEARFKAVRVKGPDGTDQIFTGSDITISMTMEAEEPLEGRQLNLALGINTMLGERLITTYTKFDPDHAIGRTVVEEGTEVECRIPEFPLVPGRYLVTLWLDRAGELMDRVQNQVELTVLPGDFYGTGVMPTETQGPYAVRHSWHVAEPARVPQVPSS
jgi:lipopolysaccharide transport system ATP-binding protein